MKSIRIERAEDIERAIRDFRIITKCPDFRYASIIRNDHIFCVCDIVFHHIFRTIIFYFRMVICSVALIIPECELKNNIFRLTGVTIGKNVSIAPGVFLDPFFPEFIEIEDHCFLGIGCKIMTHEFTASKFRFGKVRIGTGSVIGAWSVVRSGVIIGKRATTGFMSLVNRDVPDGDVVAGIPARSILENREAKS